MEEESSSDENVTEQKTTRSSYSLSNPSFTLSIVAVIGVVGVGLYATKKLDEITKQLGENKNECQTLTNDNLNQARAITGLNDNMVHLNNSFGSLKKTVVGLKKNSIASEATLTSLVSQLSKKDPELKIKSLKKTRRRKKKYDSDSESDSDSDSDFDSDSDSDIEHDMKRIKKMRSKKSKRKR